MLAYMRTCVHICVNANIYAQMLGGGGGYFSGRDGIQKPLYSVLTFLLQNYSFLKSWERAQWPGGYLCICEHICVDACIYVEMRAYMCICEHISVDACIYAEMHAYMCICEHICVDACIYAEMRAYMCICEHICVDACIYAEMRAYMCIREHICVDACIYAYKRAYMRRCEHIYADAWEGSGMFPAEPVSKNHCILC